MKAKNGLIIQQIDNYYFLIDSGEELPRFNGMVKLNETSRFIVSCLIEKEMTIDELYEEIMNEYEVDKKQLEKSVPKIIKELKGINILLE